MTDEHGLYAQLADLGYLEDGIDELLRLRFVNIDALIREADEAGRLPLDVAGATGVTAAPIFRTADETNQGHGTHTLGVDLLYVPPNVSFPPHVHPGHHLLYCVRGTGTFTYKGQVIPVRPGDLYMAEANVPHAVGAGPDGHWLLSFGAPHKHVASEDRMTVLQGEYAVHTRTAEGDTWVEHERGLTSDQAHALVTGLRRAGYSCRIVGPPLEPEPFFFGVIGTHLLEPDEPVDPAHVHVERDRRA